MEEEIEAALLLFNKQSTVTLLPSEMVIAIINDVKSKFIKGDPPELWHSFLKPAEMIEADDDGEIEQVITSSFENCSSVYLIIEYDGSNSIYYVLKIEPTLVVPFLGECQYVTYYVVDHNYQVLLCENDHNQLMRVLA